MAYEKYYENGWQNNEEGATPITAAALNHMEDGIVDLDEQVSDLNSKYNYKDVETTINSSTGRTVSIATNLPIATYTVIACSFIQNDDLYYLSVNDNIYPNVSIIPNDNNIQIMILNTQLKPSVNRTLKVRVYYKVN